MSRLVEDHERVDAWTIRAALVADGQDLTVPRPGLRCTRRLYGLRLDLLCPCGRAVRYLYLPSLICQRCAGLHPRSWWWTSARRGKRLRPHREVYTIRALLKGETDLKAAANALRALGFNVPRQPRRGKGKARAASAQPSTSQPPGAGADTV